ncbi:MAG: outer membrane beta-barrel protein [Candidatus Eremiobacteraeota bacterium]|nr:outer membrane beta-barrel protein [Candidatus Eremiobacteraeota bacterium]
MSRFFACAASTAALFGTLAFVAPLRASAQNASPSPGPSPTASPTPAPVPNVTWQTNVGYYTFETNGVNAVGALDAPTGVDQGGRADWSNIMVGVTRNTGVFRFGGTIGEYAFPVIGMALNPTFQQGANTSLYSFVPSAYVQVVPSSAWTFTLGKMATLLGQENGFTWQNVDVQRGLGWSMEPTFSRGVRATYALGKFTGDLEYNDGFYSGNHRALEGLAGWAPSANTNVQFAFILPEVNTPPNPTASVANKREYDLMVTQQFGKLQLTPYFLSVRSPGYASLGYRGDETAYAGVLIANYVFSPAWSFGMRYETVGNNSVSSDPSGNADLVGYGAGSRAQTITLTPEFKTGALSVRAEYSFVQLGAFIPGLGFGRTGNGNTQNRLGAELGVQF